MNINKSQDVYEISDTFKNLEVSGQSSVSTSGDINIHINIGDDEVFCNVFPSKINCGINMTINKFDVDVIKYLTDLADAIINL